MSRAVPSNGWLVETDSSQRALAGIGWASESASVPPPPPVESEFYTRALVTQGWVTETLTRQFALPRMHWLSEQAQAGQVDATISETLAVPLDVINATASEVSDPPVGFRHYGLPWIGWITEVDQGERSLPFGGWVGETIAEQAGGAAIASIDEVATPVPLDVIHASQVTTGTFVEEPLAVPLEVITADIFDFVGVSIEEFTTDNGNEPFTPELAPPEDVINATAAFRTVTLTLRKRPAGSGAPIPPGAGTAKFAFWDVARPDLMTTPPVAKGNCDIAIDGTVNINLPASVLPAGGVGFLTINSSDGDPNVNWLQFSGPVQVD